MSVHRYIALDTEATGNDFSNSQVIQCGAIFLDENMKEISRKEWNINYKKDMFGWMEEAAEVHGIGKEDSMVHGVEPQQFLDEFEKEIIKVYGIYAGSTLHIIAVNAYFDYLMLKLLWDKFKDEEFPICRRTMDLNTLGLLILGFGGMNSMIEEFDIEVDESRRHSALYDAEMHLVVFNKLIEMGNKKGIQFNNQD